MNGDQVNEHAKEVTKELNVTDHRAHPSDQEVYLTRQKARKCRSALRSDGFHHGKGLILTPGTCPNPWTRSGRSPGLAQGDHPIIKKD